MNKQVLSDNNGGTAVNITFVFVTAEI